MRVELEIGQVVVYRAAKLEGCFHIVYLGDGFYLRDGTIIRGRKKLHKIAVQVRGRWGRFKLVKSEE